MKLENQVSSFELNKKLKELGAKQDSLWYQDIESQQYYLSNHRDPANIKASLYVSTFTVTEGLNALPPFIIKDKNIWHLEISCMANETGEMIWEIVYYCTLKDGGLNIESDTKLADAISKMRIYLIENKLIGVK